jgi:hypothetical protein
MIYLLIAYALQMTHFAILLSYQAHFDAAGQISPNRRHGMLTQFNSNISMTMTILWPRRYTQPESQPLHGYTDRNYLSLLNLCMA